MLFDGFTRRQIDTAGATINLVVGGSGPSVLLLHGYPQTHVMWHLVAPALAEHFTVVASDLRGYGDSSKPRSDADHLRYSKRESAQDQFEVMAQLGFDQFSIVGHDRGARVAHRMLLDEGNRCRAAVLLDSAPLQFVYRTFELEHAAALYHWWFLQQPDLPERLICHEPELWVRWHLRRWSGGRDEFFAPDAVAEYVRCFSDPETIRATTECYRAGPTVDLMLDRADEGRPVEMPLLLLWSEQPGMRRDLLEAWEGYAVDVRGMGLPGGHFLAEECPDDVLAEMLPFLEEAGG